MRWGVIIITAGLLAFGQQAVAAEISGTANILDGDTLEIAGIPIHLSAIDAPELRQRCKDGKGAAWDCGASAAQALRALVQGKTVICRITGRDASQKLLADCRAEQSHINQWMVTNGWAMAFTKYDKKFLPQQSAAKRAKAGIWRGLFVEPNRWRGGVARQTQNRQARSTAASGKCVIKGNISRNGHIYHMPWQYYYDKTRISASRGERWFCSEDEAVAAGWRRSLR